MAIWAIADLHLSFGVPNKKMDLFGPDWTDHAEKIKSHWLNKISPDDLVLIPGDISWAMKLEEAIPDLLWIDALPGTKVMIRGNHDYWWSSLNKIRTILPPSIHLIQNNAFLWNDAVIGGARLWDTPTIHFPPDIYKQPLTSPPSPPEDTQTIYLRELNRLEISLKEMAKSHAPIRIVMTHYPPIDTSLNPSPVSLLLEQYHIHHCLFGHLHNVKHIPLFGTKNNTHYHLTACDYLQFEPLRVV